MACEREPFHHECFYVTGTRLFGSLLYLLGSCLWYALVSLSFQGRIQLPVTQNFTLQSWRRDLVLWGDHFLVHRLMTWLSYFLSSFMLSLLYPSFSSVEISFSIIFLLSFRAFIFLIFLSYNYQDSVTYLFKNH